MNIDFWNISDTLESFGIDVPDWIEQDIDGHTIAGILQGGCASGAYMPAVTYATALDTMSDHGDDVLDFLQHFHVQLTDTSRAGIAVHLLSAAVETWAIQVEDELTEIIESQLDMVASRWPEIRAMIVENDEPALNEGFNDWLDSLHQDGQVCDYIVNQVCREDVE